MSLLPAAMRLPEDITPLGKKVVPPAPPAKPDPVKAFETKAHPFPDGRQCPVLPKLFFGCDFGEAPDVTVVYARAMSESVKLQMDEVFLNPIRLPAIPGRLKESTATEIQLKQRAAAEHIHKGMSESYKPQPSPTAELTFCDVDHAVKRAARRTQIHEMALVRQMENRFGGAVRVENIGAAIRYLSNINRV